MKFRFVPQARTELYESADYLESEAGLGWAFHTEVMRSIERACQFPLSGAPLGSRFRRVKLERFPYGIIYKISRGELVVYAVMHLRRKPGYWRGRRP